MKTDMGTARTVLDANASSALVAARTVSAATATVIMVVGAFLTGYGCGGKTAKVAGIEPSQTWCPEGFESGPGNTCFVLPDRKENAAILLYVPSSANEQSVQNEFASIRELAAQGFAVILTRGRATYCGFTQDQKQSACWPTDLDSIADAQELAAGWEKAAWQVAALLEGSEHARQVVGYREGAAFAGRLAAQALFTASGFALIDAPATVAIPAIAESVAPGPLTITIVTNGDEPASLRALQLKAHAYATCKHAALGIHASEVREAIGAPATFAKKATKSSDSAAAAHGPGLACTVPSSDTAGSKPASEKVQR